MKSKFLIVSLALSLMLCVAAQAYDCGCNDVNPCNACNACCNQKCDLFSGLKGLLARRPMALNACGPCDAVVACAPCDVACAPPACDPVCYTQPAPACDPPISCAPISCAPVGCFEPVACGDVGCFDSCNSPCNDRPILRAVQRSNANIKRFFGGLFGSLKGCDCGMCAGRGCNACDPCTTSFACDPCGPAVGCFGNGAGCYNNTMPSAAGYPTE